MSLTRSIANPPLTSPKGIEFTLLDRSKIVRCIITRAALEKLASKELASQQFEPTFHKHQDRIEATANRMSLPMDHVMVTIQKFGNTTAATIPLCLWDYESRLKAGDKLVLAAFGGGFTWAGAYVTWAYG